MNIPTSRPALSLWAFVCAAWLLVSSASGQTPAETRLKQVEAELSRLAHDYVVAVGKAAEATPAQRSASQRQLAEIEQRMAALSSEQQQLRRATGIVPGGGIPPLPGTTTLPSEVASALPGALPSSVASPTTPTATARPVISAASGSKILVPITPPPPRELTAEGKHALCAEKFETLEKLRFRAPVVRAQLAANEDFVRKNPSANSAAAQADIAKLKAEQTYLATQISLIEESIASLGCDPATGKPKAPTPQKPTAGDPRAPTFDFTGTWRLTGPNGKIGTMTITYADSPGTIDCNDADGKVASQADRRFIGGRIEFEPTQVAFNHLYHSTGRGQWRALESGGPPRPAVFLGCVTGGNATIWLHPETGNTPDCVLKIRGDPENKTMAEIDGNNLNRSYPDGSGGYRWWRMRK